MRPFLLLAAFTLTIAAHSQPTQTIRGRVVDADSRVTLPGATVRVYQSDSLITGDVTDVEGLFRIPDVVVGRYSVDVSYVGYKPEVISDVILTSAKEMVLEVALAEGAVSMKEVVVTATEKGEAFNEMALVSAQSFTIDETNRYAGSRGDPARMASNFAGVQGNDDSNNGIIVRGNSPYFMAWKLENIYVPNPNHFSVVGRSSGPVSMLNNRYLANSDFFTGAFPASYGNSIGSVFDLRMKPGNNEQHEGSFQFGFLGTELFAEGPISRSKRSSYIINYRYATVSIFQKLGIDIGTDAVPNYQDLAFKLNFPGKKNSNLSVFGLGGRSTTKIIQSRITDTSRIDIYQSKPSDEHFRSGRATLGANWGKSFGSRTYMNIHAAGILDFSANDVYDVIRHIENGMFVFDSLILDQTYLDQLHRVEIGGFVTTKPGVNQVLKVGLDVSNILLDFYQRTNSTQYGFVFDRTDYEGWTVLVQPFVDYKRYLSERVEVVGGLHFAYLTLNGSKSVEPRLGVKWNVAERQSITLGSGMHSQMQLPYYYLPRVPLPNGEFELSNINLDFFRSVHVVAGYQRFFGTNVRTKAEVYYQYLYNIPVQSYASSFSQLNEGEDYTDFIPDSLVSEGVGRNLGVELTIERFFSKGYYFLVTGSLFDAKYQGSNGIQYNTAFNGRYAANALLGKEFKWGKVRKSTFGVSVKSTVAGGRRATPIDTAASQLEGQAVYVDSLRNSLQLREYFRTDIRLSYSLSARKVAHEIGIDLVNAFDRQNILRRVYTSGQVREVYQLGLLPIFYYRIDF